MKMFRPMVLGMSFAVAGCILTAAQSTPSLGVLQITREYTKPYKNGMAHDKTESAFVQAMTKAKFPAYYVGFNAMSGRSRSIYITHYDSFAEWEKDNKIQDKNATLSAEVERASIADGELLDEVTSGVYTFESDLSYKPRPDLIHARYLEVSEFHLKSGKREEWNKLAKLVKDAHDKAGTSAHWAMYEVAYGAADGTFVALSADNSMADIDTGYAENKKFSAALGEDGMKQMREMFADCVASSSSDLYSINPKQSYVPDEWIKGDPDFWKAKGAAAPAAKPAAPAAKPDATKKP